MRNALPILTLLLLLAPAATSPASAAEPRRDFADVTTVVAVEVPVQVLQDGKPVRGLGRDNFEILDGRKVQAITGFEEIDLTEAVSQPGTTPTAPPAAGRRHFLMLLDLSNSDPTAITKGRQAIRHVVTESLHPSDLVAVATYRTGNGTQLLIGFTSDRRQVDIALDTLGNEKLFERGQDALRLVIANTLRDQVAMPGAGPTGDQRGAADAVMLEMLRDLSRQESQAVRSNELAKVTTLTSNLADLGRLMSNVDGRKYVVYLSQGFDARLLTGTTDQAETEQMARDVEAGGGALMNVDSTARFGDTRAISQLETMLEELRRADCVIQAVDIGGMVTGGDQRPRASGRETLFAMAKGTGGQLYENFADLGGAMRQMLDVTSVTYLLTFQPAELKLDGKYRSIKVRLKNGPEGARLVHRPGYYAPLPYEQRRGVEKQLDTAQLLLAGEPGGSLKAGAVATAFKMDPDRAFVPAVVEVSGASLMALPHDKPIGVDVFVYALDTSGTVRDFIAQNLQLDLAKLGDKLKQGNLRVMGSLFLAPGDYVLRVLVRESAGEYSLSALPLSVPDFAAGKVIALQPLFPESMASGLVPRPAVNPQKPKDPMFPFVVGKDEFYLPRGLPQIASGGDARLCWLTYGLGAGNLVVQGQVFTAAGTEVPGATARLVERSAFDQPGLERLTVEFKAPKLAPGDYVLRLSVTDPTTKAVTSSVASFSAGS